MTKNQKLRTIVGFTLIEILIYTGIFAIVGGMLTGILINATRVEQRESASAEVTSQLNFVMQTIQRLVRESSNIEIDAGTATSTLKLRMRDSAKDPTYITLASNAIKLQEGSSATTTLTSDKVTVNTLSFKKFTQYPGHDTVSIDLTMTYNTQNTAGQVQRTLSSAIARVSAATFDSDILPGTDNTYSIGFNPSTRWKDGTFAGNLTVNGNVGIGTTNPGKALDVIGGVGTNDYFYLRAANSATGSSTQGIEFSPIYTGTTRTPVADIKFLRTSATDGNYDGEMAFFTRATNIDTSGTVERMRIDKNGNVGIGTTTPSALLHIQSVSANAAVMRLQDTSGAGTRGGEILGGWNGNGLYLYSLGSSGHIYIGSNPTSNAGTGIIHFYNSDSEAVTIKSGNVGIATTTPSQKLTVVGTIESTSGGFKFPDATTQTSAASAVPTGAILYFATSTCPTGWSEITAARGRYIVGLPSGGTVSSTVGTALSDLENRAAGVHTHQIWATIAAAAGSSHRAVQSADAGGNNAVTGSGDGLVSGTNAPYIQFLVCQKS